MIKKLILALGIFIFIGISATIVGKAMLLLNLKSGLLVLVGTLIIGFLGFPMKNYKDLIKTLCALFRPQEIDYKKLVKQIERMSHINRVYGEVVLEKELRSVDNLFLRKGVDLIVDGYDPYEIQRIMEKEFELHFSRKEPLVNIMNTLQKLAPAIGFIGTIIGLINVLGNMGDPAEMGKGMAVALLTTLYGLLFSNFLFLPLSKKLAEKFKAESTLLYIILEGILDISRCRNPRAIGYRLGSYLRNYCGTQEYSLDFPESIRKMASRGPLQKLVARKQHV